MAPWGVSLCSVTVMSRYLSVLLWPANISTVLCMYITAHSLTDFQSIFMFVPARKSLAISLPVYVLTRASETCCMDEAAVVWILNALLGKKQQTEAELSLMLCEPAVLPVQRNYEYCPSFCICLFFFLCSLTVSFWNSMYTGLQNGSLEWLVVLMVDLSEAAITFYSRLYTYTCATVKAGKGLVSRGHDVCRVI